MQLPAGDINNNNYLIKNSEVLMNLKFLLLVMCVFTFSVHAAHHSHSVVKDKVGKVYRSQNNTEINFRVTDVDGLDLSVSYLIRDGTFCSTSRSEFLVQINEVVINGSHQLSEAFKALEKLWLKQNSKKRK